MKRSKKLAIIAAALLAVAPVASSVVKSADGVDTVLAAKKPKKAKKVKKTKKVKKSKKKSKKNKKKTVKLVPYNDGSSSYSFKGWKTIGTNMGGYTTAYAFVKYPNSGNEPFIQFVLINPNTEKVAYISGGYKVSEFKNFPVGLLDLKKDSPASALAPSQLKAIQKIIKKKF